MYRFIFSGNEVRVSHEAMKQYRRFEALNEVLTLGSQNMNGMGVMKDHAYILFNR